MFAPCFRGIMIDSYLEVSFLIMFDPCLEVSCLVLVKRYCVWSLFRGIVFGPCLEVSCLIHV